MTRNNRINTAICLLLLCFSSKAIAQPGSNNLGQQTPYSGNFYAISGKQYTIQSFNGLNTWLVILPDSISISDSSLLIKIDSIASSNTASLQTMVIPVFNQAGNLLDGGGTLTPWYKSMISHGVIFHSPLQRDKARRSAREAIFTWLTQPGMNGHYSQEITSAGQMYLLDAQGYIKGAYTLQNLYDNRILKIIFP